MKKISLQIIVIVVICCIPITYKIYSTHVLEKMKLEVEKELHVKAIEAGMVQVPVDICTELHQELKWVLPENYNQDIMIEGVE